MKWPSRIIAEQDAMFGTPAQWWTEKEQFGYEPWGNQAWYVLESESSATIASLRAQLQTACDNLRLENLRAEEWRKRTEAAERALREVEERFKRKGHHGTCSYALGGLNYACDCGWYVVLDYFARREDEKGRAPK